MPSAEYRVLVVDDEPAVAALHARYLREAGYRPYVLTDSKQVLPYLASHPSVALVVLDILMPEPDGIAVLRELRVRHPSVGVIMATVVNRIGDAVGAIKAGAYNYLLKPIDRNRLTAAVASYFTHRPPTIVADPRFSQFVTGEKQLLPLFQKIQSFAAAEVPTLVTGETGTGKDVVARLLHSLSPRREGPFVAMNVSAFGPDSFEAALFGRESGGVPGAPGFLSLASGGTLFIDDIGELARENQKKLLSLFQVSAVGPTAASTPPVPDVRFVLATNRDLRAACTGGEFREDLYFRISGHRIDLPPLRHRKGDIVLLATYFLRKYSAQYGRMIDSFDDDCLARLQAYEYPGNVRELEVLVSAAVLVEPGVTLSLASLPPHVRNVVPLDGTDLEAVRYRAIMDALARHGGNQTKASQELGIARGTLNRLLRSYRSSQEGSLLP
jgi:DNA-binding NtrC family response regulator